MVTNICIIIVLRKLVSKMYNRMHYIYTKYFWYCTDYSYCHFNLCSRPRARNVNSRANNVSRISRQYPHSWNVGLHYLARVYSFSYNLLAGLHSTLVWYWSSIKLFFFILVLGNVFIHRCVNQPKRLLFHLVDSFDNALRVLLTLEVKTCSRLVELSYETEVLFRLHFQLKCEKYSNHGHQADCFSSGCGLVLLLTIWVVQCKPPSLIHRLARLLLAWCPI